MRIALAGTLLLLNSNYYVIDMRTHAMFLRAILIFALSNFKLQLVASIHLNIAILVIVIIAVRGVVFGFVYAWLGRVFKQLKLFAVGRSLPVRPSSSVRCLHHRQPSAR